MMELDRVPDSAAIHSTVELTKGLDKPWLTRFVNALLRQYQRRRDDISWPDDAKSPSLAVAVNTSHPEWLVRRWMARLGNEETRAVCEANNTIPAISLRANTLKTDRRRLASALGSSADRIDTRRFLPDALNIEGIRVAVDRMAPFQSGWFQVQDEASQLISLVLDPQPGDRVVDACAGRGGKTGHLAQLMDNRGDLIAVDIDGDKLRTLTGEMVRLGVTIVRTLEEDLTSWEDGELKALADRVLVDAPCSGLGVIRRHPEARWDPRKRDLNRFQLRQGLLLEKASRLVRPGGILVYAVCSTEPEEGIDVVRSFLRQNRAFELARGWGKWSEHIAPFSMESGIFASWPHRHGTDGFFASRLIKSNH
jgi:16S rRNA (cytosine967-C5)-methyltransferase